MKLDKDPFPTNMNTIELDGKKVLVRPSQAESTKGKEVITGEERQTEDDQAQKSWNWSMKENKDFACRRKFWTGLHKGINHAIDYYSKFEVCACNFNSGV
jgi:hypothetical protein